MSGRILVWRIAAAVIFLVCVVPVKPAQAAEKEGLKGHVHYKVPDEYKEKKNPYWTNLHAILEGGLIYEEKCAVCHGDTGRGNGPLARFFDPKPTNYTDSRMMAEMSDSYLLWRVSEGGKSAPFNSVMPRWKGAMKEDEMWKVIAYIHAFSHGTEHLKLEHIHSPESMAEDSEAESKGHVGYKVPDEYKGKKNPYWTNLPAILDGGLIYREKCAVCHGKGGRGDGLLAQILDPRPVDFTDSRAMADVNDDYLFWRVSEGGQFWPFDSVMPRWKGIMKEDEIWKVISYVHAFSHGTEHLKLEHVHMP